MREKSNDVTLAEINERLAQVERMMRQLLRETTGSTMTMQAKTQSPFVRRKEAIRLLGTRSLLEACERAGWFKASTRRPRLVQYPREQVMAAVYRLSLGEYPR
jgi:hypothetical protein